MAGCDGGSRPACPRRTSASSSRSPAGASSAAARSCSTATTRRTRFTRAEGPVRDPDHDAARARPSRSPCAGPGTASARWRSSTRAPASPPPSRRSRMPRRSPSTRGSSTACVRGIPDRPGPVRLPHRRGAAPGRAPARGPLHPGRAARAPKAGRVERTVAGRDGEIPLTQEQLAELAGTSRATVNRVLRDEQAEGRSSSGAAARSSSSTTRSRGAPADEEREAAASLSHSGGVGATPYGRRRRRRTRARRRCLRARRPS